MANAKTEPVSSRRGGATASGPAPAAPPAPGGPKVETTERRFETLSGIPVRPLYTEADQPADLDARLGRPGEYPYTRGLHPEMYRTRLWTMRQFAGFGTAEHTNQRFHYLLAQGMTGLSTAFDMPTLMGYDADHPMSLGEVGREGVAVGLADDGALLLRTDGGETVRVVAGEVSTEGEHAAGH